MEVLIFDMDGVLLEPLGYHHALRETVRLAGKDSGFGDVYLSAAQIARFEALGISSEWHSSALCLAWMTLQKEYAPDSRVLDWDRLVAAFQRQPQSDSPILRGAAALSQVAQEQDVCADRAVTLMKECESIQESPTFNWFQELVLGSAVFTRIYGKAGQLNTESYLQKYDRRLLAPDLARKVLDWARRPGRGGAIMTSRPSAGLGGPQGFAQEPDGQMGAELVGLGELPLIGNGEMRWLAEKLGVTVAEVKKPAAAHALAALLAAGGWTLEDGLDYLTKGLNAMQREDLNWLDGSTVTVVEDTISGLLAMRAAVDILEKLGLRIAVQNVGVATDAAKVMALEEMGAVVYPDVNLALDDLLATDAHR